MTTRSPSAERFFISNKPPSRRLFHLATKSMQIAEWATVVTLIGIALLLTPQPVIIQGMLGGLWGILIFIYGGARRILTRIDHPWMHEEYVSYHAAIGVLGTALIYGMLQLAGYGPGGTDPVYLCLVALAPLALISRYGQTQHWALWLVIAAGLLVGSRLGWPLFVTGPGRPATWAQAVADYGASSLGLSVELVFLLLASSGVHFAFRVRRTRDFQIRIAYNVANSLAHGIIPADQYDAAAQAIRAFQDVSYPGLELYFPYVHIMRYDSRTDRLCVVGGAGKDPCWWSGVEVMPGTGLTGAAFRDREPKKHPAVKTLPPDQYIQPPGYEDVNSEMVVPIYYQDAVLGVLDVQSPEFNAFADADKQLLEILAAGLGIAIGNASTIDTRVRQAVGDSLELASATLNLGWDYSQTSPWFAALASEACRRLNANLLMFYELSPGNYFPHVSPLIFPAGSAPVPTWPIPRVSSFWKLHQDWRREFDLTPDKTDAWAKDFLMSRDIHTLAFLPVGVNEQLGMLFVGYQRDEPLSDIQRLALTTFSLALEDSYRRVASRATPEEWSLALHDLVGTDGQAVLLSMKNLESQVSQRDGEPPPAEAASDQMQQMLERLTLIIFGHDFTLGQSLETWLNNTAARLNHRRRDRPAVFQYSGLKLVERLEPDLAHLFYRITAEAMSNAIQHGDDEATQVTLVGVDYALSDDGLSLAVTDNGCGLKPSHPRSRPRGIYSWQDFIRQEYHADLRIEPREGGGVRVSLTLPLLPWVISTLRQP